jgi:hypothetical protein
VDDRGEQSKQNANAFYDLMSQPIVNDNTMF